MKKKLDISFQLKIFNSENLFSSKYSLIKIFQVLQNIFLRLDFSVPPPIIVPSILKIIRCEIVRAWIPVQIFLNGELRTTAYFCLINVSGNFCIDSHPELNQVGAKYEQTMCNLRPFTYSTAEY